MNMSHKISLAIRSILSVSILLVPLVSAHAFDGEDWVLVKYFNDKMAEANKGDDMAMFNVGQLYERGRGTKTDLVEAINWYKRATDKGNNYARARLGVMYYEGVGVTKDVNKAQELIQEAAKAEVPAAEYYLGVMYENGDGVKASRDKAKYWYELAIKHGSYRAKSRLQALEKGYINIGHKSTTNNKKAKPASAKVNLSSALRDAVLDGNWQRNELAAGFLPSAITSCTKLKNNVIRCMSQKQERSTGDRVITYVTASTLSDFNSRDQFKVQYQNTILTSAKKGNVIVAEDDEGDYAVAASNAAPGAGLGKQKTVHKLECEMEEANKLVCLKNRALRMTYTNKK